jgi:hypothetical protein
VGAAAGVEADNAVGNEAGNAVGDAADDAAEVATDEATGNVAGDVASKEDSLEDNAADDAGGAEENSKVALGAAADGAAEEGTESDTKYVAAGPPVQTAQKNAAVSPPDAALGIRPPLRTFVRLPALQLFRSTACPDRVLALISVHANPGNKFDCARREAVALGNHIPGWLQQQLSHVRSACVMIAGDFNLAAPRGGTPLPGSAWDKLLRGGFEPVQFADDASKVTNLQALGRKEKHEFDHAFVSRERAPWLAHYSAARVVNVTDRMYSPPAADLVALRAAQAVATKAGLALKTAKEALEQLADSVAKLQVEVIGAGSGQGMHQRHFSDHLPASFALFFEQGQRAGNGSGDEGGAGASTDTSSRFGGLEGCLDARVVPLNLEPLLAAAAAAVAPAQAAATAPEVLSPPARFEAAAASGKAAPAVSKAPIVGAVAASLAEKAASEAAAPEDVPAAEAEPAPAFD